MEGGGGCMVEEEGGVAEGRQALRFCKGRDLRTSADIACNRMRKHEPERVNQTRTRCVSCAIDRTRTRCPNALCGLSLIEAERVARTRCVGCAIKRAVCVFVLQRETSDAGDE